MDGLFSVAYCWSRHIRFQNTAPIVSVIFMLLSRPCFLQYGVFTIEWLIALLINIPPHE